MGARAQADNGDYARLSDSGTFNIRSGKATGGGVFARPPYGVSVAVGQAGFDGVLTVTCLIGPDVPAGAEEGIALDIPGVINFDDLVPEESGLTLFVAPS